MKYRAGNLKINLLCDSPRRSSFVWKWFGHLIKINEDNDDDYEETICKERVFCSICLLIESRNPDNLIEIDEFINKSSYALTNQSTQTYSWHLTNIHQIFETLTNEETARRVNCLLNDFPINEINQDEFEYKVAIALINTYTPFNFLKNRFVKQLFKSVLPDKLKLLKRRSITIKSEKIYNSTYQAIVSVFKGSKIQFGAIDLDIWFNKVKNESYLGINFHFFNR